MTKRFSRVERTDSPNDQARRDAARQTVKAEFPPKRRKLAAAPPTPGGIGNDIRAVRTERGLTWYAVAKMAGIPNSGTVRAIEEGRDAKLSSVEAIANVLGLRLTAVKT